MNESDPTPTEIAILSESFRLRTMLTCFVLAAAKQPNGAQLLATMEAELAHAAKIEMPAPQQDIFRQVVVSEIQATLRRLQVSVAE